MRDEKQRFSLRKLSVGLASVLIGITFLENGQTVKADTVNKTQENAITETNKAGDSGSVQTDANTQNDNAVKQNTDAAQNKVQNSAQDAVQNKVSNDVQNNTQADALNVQQNADSNTKQNNVQPNTPVVKPVVKQNAKVDFNTVTTTISDLNFKSAVSVNMLKDSKVQVSKNNSASDLSTQSDPSKLSPDDFAPGTKWTTAGWTRTNPQYVAKSSDLKLTSFDGNNQMTTDWGSGSNLSISFTIDKNQLAKNRRFLIGTVQDAFDNQKQDFNQVTSATGTWIGSSFDGYRVNGGTRDIIVNDKKLGYVDFADNDKYESDIYFVSDVDSNDVASDIKGTWATTNLPLFFSGTDWSNKNLDFKTIADNFKFPLTHNVITNAGVYTHIITPATGYTTHDPNMAPSSWYYNDNIYNAYGICGFTRENDPVIKVWKLKSTDPTAVISEVAGRKRYKYIDKNNLITDWDWDMEYFRTDANVEPMMPPLLKKQDNLSALDLMNSTNMNETSVSKQADGSFLVCEKIDFGKYKANINDLKTTVSKSYLANLIDPQHRDQIANNTYNYYTNDKNPFISYDTFAFITGDFSKPNTVFITDVTPNQSDMTTIVSQHTVNGTTANTEFYRNANIQYLDDDNSEKNVSSDVLIGRKNVASDYTVNIPQGFVLAKNNNDGTNYKWSVDKKKISYTFQDDQKQNDANPIIIHLVHNHETVDHGHNDSALLYANRNRTIHYVYDDGTKALDDVVQPVLFTRTATEDMANHDLSNFSEWVPDDDYPQVSVPIIHGYTPSQNIIPEASANPDHDAVLTVTYSKNKQQINVSYIDDTTGTTLDTKRLDGYSGDDAKYSTKSSIDDYKAHGYELVSDSSNGAELIFDKDDFVNDQDITVHLKHATQDTNLEHDVTRTIHYVYANGQKANDDYSHTLKFTGTETIDKVTDKAIKTVWTPETKNFDEVASPVIHGYTANQTLMSDIEVNPTSDNIVQTVTYNPNKQNIHIVFIDDTTGNTLNTVEKSGYTGTDSGYATQDDIDALIAKGYKLVSDDTPKESPTLHFDSDDFTDDQNFTVHMKHDTKTNNLTREVTRTIHYVYVGGKPAGQDKIDSVKFNGVETIDKVNGNVLSTVWTPESKEFASVNTPSLAGYTPDKFSVDSSTIKPDSDNIAVTVTYNPDVQYAKFNYIDDTTGNQLKQETSHGVTGGRDSYSTANLISYYKNKGYDLVSDDTQDKTLTFDNDDNTDQVYAIHFAHGTVTIDPQNPGKPGEKLNPQDPSSSVYPDGSDNLTRKVDREIDYIHSDGSTAKPSVKDSLTFNNTEEIDKVTGQIISSTWDGPKDFADISSPIIEGYTPDKSSVENKGVKHDNSPIKVVIKYSADSQHMKVIYRDLTTSQILSQFTKDGVSDEDGRYNTKSAIDGYVANGYVLSRDDTNGKDLIFDHNDKLDQVYYVDFIHGTHQYNPEKPNTKDQVNKSDYLADYNTVISYVDSSNKKLSSDKTVADEYKRDLTIDSVTGKILSCGEWQLNKAYTAVNNPVIQGYITRDKQYKPVDAQKNQKFDVIYAQLGKLHLVDNKGKQIAPDVVYSNDAQDPTKASVTKVPSVNGYEQITFRVDPTKDPTTSQNVVFNAPAQVIINYVDTNTSKIIHTDTVKGFATHTSDYSTKNEISNLVGQGYVLTKNNVPTSIKLTEDPQNYTVNLVHGISKVSHNNPVKGGSLITGTKQTMPNGVDTGDLNRIITRTITVIDPHTGKKTTKQIANLFRDATVDNVTKTITYTDWNTATWGEFTTPIVAGYTPSATLVEKENVTPDTKDSAITITYTANTQTGKISYVDTEGHEVDHTPLSGKTDEDVKVTPVIPHGWVVVDGPTIPNIVKATANGIPTVSVKIKHGTIEITPDKPHNPTDKMPDGDTYPDGVTSGDLNRDITRTINVVDPHTGLHTTIQTAHLSRNAVVDLVTKAITYGKWNTATWDEFTTPIVAGYTPSVKNVTKADVDIATKNTNIDITYTANPQTGKISYVDKNGKEISKTDLTGKTDEEVKVMPSLPHGWVLDGKQDIPTSVKAGPDGIPTVTIKIKHGQLIVTPDKPHKNTDKMPDGDNYPKGVDTGDLNKDVTRTIVLHMPNGDKQVNQVAKYTRVATIDLVTGKVTYSDWDTKTGWAKFEVPSANGYKPSQKEIVAVAKPKKDTKIVINYTALPSDDDWNGVPIVSTTPSEPQKPTPTTSNQNGNSQKPDSNKQKPAKQNKKVNKKRRQNKKRNNSVKLNGASAVISANSVKNGENRNNNRAVSNINNNGTGQIAENNSLSSNANSNSSVNTILKQNSASQLPQTGNKGGAEALAGMLLASMGIATAIGANRKKKHE